MYWRQGNDMAETSSSGSSTPPTPSSGLPSPALNELPWPALQSETTKEVLQSVLKVRKTWKTLRGGETVWPLELEAALLEGLEKYVPDDSRETRMLGRFPRRNRFISDYIYEKTGKRRSAKQVGSRLQQLRESCGGRQLLHLLSPFREPAYPDSAASGDSALSSPVEPLPGDSMFPGLSSSRHTVMYIDILPTGAPDDVRRSSKPSPWSDSGDIVRASDHPRSIGSINPVVSFTSRSPLVAHSRFTVYSEDLILHAETVPLTLLPQQAPQSSDFLYSTRMVPKYWQVILDSPDPTRFTIFQEVVREDNSLIAFSATYKFSYPVRRLPNSSSSSYLSPAPKKSWLGVPFDHSTQSYELPSLADTRYPMFEPASWNAALKDAYTRENSPPERYHSPGSDSSSVCFPSELSHYVS
ncbi:hypothetical protein FB451DRAFT_1281077 [Mycena latifolia]|nr:hypothetical protein FB451DRAFT_1281077 [Mycena latifolia]